MSVTTTEALEHMRGILAVLGERVARVVEADRSEGDVADHQRGLYFPPALITRDARRNASGAASDVVPLDMLPSRLVTLAENLGLNALEVGILLIGLSVNMDPRFEQFFIVLNNEVDTRGPNVATALRLAGADPMDPDARALLRPDASLRALGLIELGRSERPLLTSVITVPERVVSFLLGDNSFDAVATPVLDVLAEANLPDELLPELPEIESLPVVLRSRAGSAARDQARRLGTSNSGMPPLIIDGSALSAVAADCQAQLTACIREGALWGSVLVLDLRHCTPVIEREQILTDLSSRGVPFIALVERRARMGRWESEAVSLELPGASLRRQWWTHLGAPDGAEIAADAASHVEPEDIRKHLAEGSPLAPHLVTGRGLSQPIEPEFTLADVLTNESISRDLRELRDRVRNRSIVLDEWGMRPGGGRGRGVTALFSGPSGTGKTMAAEALAGELGVPLFRVDLAAVVDKYIGETEKNLDRIFSSVEDVDGVLLFDEADALFGKRSEVSDARDRYANLEVAYLLQRMESFDGLAILTSNLRANLDTAFLRRLDSVVDFPEPDPHNRELLWLACLTGQLGLVVQDDIRRLAALPMAGGAIRAAVVTAAYLAAEAGSVMDRRFLLEACEREWRKIGRLSFPNADFADWLSEAPNDGAGAGRRDPLG
jgi:AAA+ superfamily predicted ATPase